MALMDSAGARGDETHARSRVAAVAVTNIAFHEPVRVGDAVCCYVDPVKFGRTSLSFHIEVWVLRSGKMPRTKTCRG